MADEDLFMGRVKEEFVPDGRMEIEEEDGRWCLWVSSRFDSQGTDGAWRRLRFFRLAGWLGKRDKEECTSSICLSR